MGVVAAIVRDLRLVQLIEVTLSCELVEFAREVVIAEVREVALSELELGGVLSQQLVHTVKKEHEKWRKVL